MSDIGNLLGLAPVVPVVVLDDAKTAVPLARALVAGGIPAIEVTLRTPVALEAIRAIAGEVEGAVVGAGTVLTPRQLADSAAAGARFAVSPGATPTLLDADRGSPIPLLPGSATPSEVMALLERGFRYLKLFPAEAVGGVALLKSMASPLPAARFCPTGGIGPDNAPDYLALPNVVCVGGSWLAPADAVREGAWDRITALAKAAAALPRASRGPGE